ncbi:MAG: hypothetical protein INH43_08505 [Acidobacteriaceae bacterium]|jgi:hypothetical protein|nr:hypothetical protein [Acidobacteriaceae bacterium]
MRGALASVRGNRQTGRPDVLAVVTRWASFCGGDATGINRSEKQAAAATELAEDNRTAFRTGSIYEPGFQLVSVDIASRHWHSCPWNGPGRGSPPDGQRCGPEAPC